MKAREPSLRMSDQLLLSRAAMLSNEDGGTALPEAPGDYTIEYRGVSESSEETKGRAELIKAKLEMGLISKVDALRELNPEIGSDEEAIERLLRIQRLAEVLNTQSEQSETAL